MTLSPRILLPALVLGFGLALVSVAAWLTFSGPGAPPPSSIGAPFRLTGSDGEKVSDAELNGADDEPTPSPPATSNDGAE